MGDLGDERVRVDVWMEDAYVGELRLNLDEWQQLEDARDDGELEVELR
jgi:hypothetical protein